MAEETDAKIDIDINDDDDLDAAFDEQEESEALDDSEEAEEADSGDAEAEDGDDTPAPAEGEEVDDEDPSDVEDDLGTILKERLVAEDEDEPEPEDADLVVQQHGDSPDEQFVCMGCFLKVSASQFGEAGQRVCPNGEDPCPSVELLGG